MYISTKLPVDILDILEMQSKHALKIKIKNLSSNHSFNTYRKSWTQYSRFDEWNHFSEIEQDYLCSLSPPIRISL
jgi:hypothetical protein